MEESVSQSYVVFGVVGVLVVFNIGLLGVVRLVVLAILLVLSAIVAFLLALYSSCRVDESPKCSRVFLNRSGLNLRPVSRRSIKHTNTDLTGSAAVDAHLQEMMDFVIRDFVYSWYYKISSNQQFPWEVRNCMSRAISILADRMAEVDWVPLLTKGLVDDIASHLRLYKLARNRSRSPLKEGEARVAEADLESLFFDAEMEMEGNICRDSVCMERDSELKYLQDLSDLLLYLLLPQQEFESGSVRTMTREILSCSVLGPLLNLVSDPDVINQNLIWLLRDCEIRSEVFISTLHHSDSLGELEASRFSIQKELSRLRSRDSHADDTEEAKNQLNSLVYLKKVVDAKINRLQSGFSSNSYGLPANIDWSNKISTTAKLFNLPLEVILKNNISLSYFIDYMSSMGCQYLVFFYLNIEGWKVAAEQQLQALELEIMKQEDRLGSGDNAENKASRSISNDKEATCLESIREAATSIYQEYLSDKANPRVNIEDSVCKRLVLKIRTETPDPDWFDEVAGKIYQDLESNEKYLINFKRSVGYLKLLAELDLLKVDMYEDDEDGSLGSLGESIGENSSTGSMDTGSCRSAGPEPSSGSDTEFSRISPNPPIPEFTSLENLGERSVVAELSVELTGVEMGKEPSGKQYAMYVLHVGHGRSTWDVTRRYSDFYHLQSNLNTQFPVLEKIPFPGKKTFGNLEKNIVEKRKKMLHEYLQGLLLYAQKPSYPGLGQQILDFLLPNWEISRPGVVERAVTAVSQDIQRSVKTVSSAVTSVPGNIVKNVDNVVDGITKAFVTKDISPVDVISSVKVGASIEENEENIPLRITLLFLDEVFDLAERNRWLRRQIITVLRQIIDKMFGDIVNKKIVDYITALTSEEAVAGYLNSLKEAIWPGGHQSGPAPKREESQKQRCRVAARASLIASLPDDLRRVIGSETSRTGLMMIFEMLQYNTLNRRLVIVLLESVIVKLFPDHKFEEMFEKLHSRSCRSRNDFKNSQRTASDLRHRREKSK